MWHLAKALMVPGFLFSVVMVCTGWAQTQGVKDPTAAEIVARMQVKNSERQAALEYYSSNRTYQLEYSGAGGEHHATIAVHAEYTAPGRKQLTVMSESGSKVLCKEVLLKLVEREQQTASKADWQRTMFSAETYNVELIGLEQLEGVSTWVLKVEPKAESKIAYRGKVWVSTDDFATVRVMGEPAKSPSWLLDRASFDSWYMRRGDIWVPSRNVSTTHVRIGGEAKVTIDYGAYQVLSAKEIGAGEEHADEAETSQAQSAAGKVALASGLMH
jgi:hypothetical protein